MAVDWDKQVIGPCFDVFAEPVTYMPASSSAFASRGVFDRENRDVNLLEEVGTSIAYPILGMRLSEFPEGVVPLQGDRVQVPSVNATFMVRDSKPDGHGYVKLLLNLAAP